MQRFQRILVATDTRLENQSIVAEAANRAHRNHATLKLVDVVPLLPWTTRLMVSDHENISRLMIREKQEQLDKLAEPLRAEGIDVETKVLHGQTSIEIILEVLRGKHDLVMRVTKGSDSRRKGFFGETGTRLVRECPCAVHLVAPSTSPQRSHVMACIDTSEDDPVDAELNESIYTLAEMLSEQHNARLSILQAWMISGEGILDGRMNRDEFTEMQRSSEANIKGSLNKFLQGHGRSVADSHVHLLKGNRFDVIPEFAKTEAVDLIVMGTAARGGAVDALFGNTVECILDSIACSALVVKPSGFVSRIKLGDYVVGEHT